MNPALGGEARMAGKKGKLWGRKGLFGLKRWEREAAASLLAVLGQIW